jgi:hypothetical protein
VRPPHVVAAMNRFAPIIAVLVAIFGLGGCAAGVQYGPYGGTYYSGAYPGSGYGYDYPYDSLGLGGAWVGGGYRGWHHWHEFHEHHHWAAWHGGGFHHPVAWAGRGHWAGHGWHR